MAIRGVNDGQLLPACHILLPSKLPVTKLSRWLRGKKEVLVTKTGDLSSIPRDHVVKGESQLPRVVISCHICHDATPPNERKECKFPIATPHPQSHQSKPWLTPFPSSPDYSSCSLIHPAPSPVYPDCCHKCLKHYFDYFPLYKSQMYSQWKI